MSELEDLQALVSTQASIIREERERADTETRKRRTAEDGRRRLAKFAKEQAQQLSAVKACESRYLEQSLLTEGKLAQLVGKLRETYGKMPHGGIDDGWCEEAP